MFNNVNKNNFLQKKTKNIKMIVKINNNTQFLTFYS